MAQRKRDQPLVVWSLRTFLVLNLISAVGFIVYAIILENPPKTALPVGLLIIGVFSLVAVLIGLIGSLRIACCLNIYLILGGILTLAELGITLSMFFNYDKTWQSLNDYAKKHDQNWDKEDTDNLKAKVAGGRWFFLVVCILQAISVLVAVVMRVCLYPRERSFEQFDEEGNQLPSDSQIQMQKLQQSINRNQPAHHSPGTAAYASSKLNKSTTQKMAAKYGDFSQGEFQQKGFFGKLFGK